ncbi:DUF2934 domain-containing protein [Variovorax ginsengisoli]|uniref:DUF2934 domain-containing protein n=1 Tax=Variovorax ginsengisoli TaxID=363844 RepID=A0ABT9SDE0_9BURK|nr:DUF2934 domain-containing protein [Variovorax ginsengisoli]MDP9902376.1 hypothetical protein [Variovorax ginsengisoli]
MSNIPVIGSGDGTRPATSGGVDNMGAGESFTGKKNAAGEDVSGPGPAERMKDRRRNVEATKQDDSAPFGLTEDLTPQSNREPVVGEAAPLDSAPDEGGREAAIRRAAYEAYQRREREGGGAGSEEQDWLQAEQEIDRKGDVSTATQGT